MLHKHDESGNVKLHLQLDCLTQIFFGSVARFTVHEKVRKYACLECDKMFTQKYFVAEHMKRFHEKIKREKSLACDSCKYKTPYSWLLKKHLRRWN